MELTAEQGRVVGSLVEKEATVPDTYPMTLNGLRGACNQQSARHPVVTYPDSTVMRALDALKDLKLVRFVHASHGARTTRYRHVLDEVLGLSPAELAVVAVLLLRGPQTVGELRSRTERQHRFGSIDEVEEVLGDLSRREPPLVRFLSRQPGHKEARWAQLLAAEAEVVTAVPPAAAGAAAPAPLTAATAPAAPAAPATGAAAVPVDGEVARLRAELDELRARFDELCHRLGEEIEPPS